MKKSRRGYTRQGEYTEVRVRKEAAYKEVCESAAAALDIELSESDSDVDDEGQFHEPNVAERTILHKLSAILIKLYITDTHTIEIGLLV